MRSETRARPRLISTAAGTHQAAFGLTEWALLSSIALIWGSSFMFIEIGLEAFRPAVVTLARVALGLLFLALVPRARRAVERADLPRIALLGAIWQAIPLLLFPVAQQWIDSSLAGMLNGAMPLVASAVAALLLRRLPGPLQLAGLVLGFGGVVAISWPAVEHADATALGTALVLLAITLYGISANLAVPLQQRYGSLAVLLRSQIVALVLVAPFGLWEIPASTWSWAAAGAMLPLGVLGTGLAFIAMATLVGRAGATRGSIAIYFIPVVAIVLGVVVRDESVAPISLAGTALVVVGAWLTSRRES